MIMIQLMPSSLCNSPTSINVYPFQYDIESVVVEPPLMATSLQQPPLHISHFLSPARQSIHSLLVLPPLQQSPLHISHFLSPDKQSIQSFFLSFALSTTVTSPHQPLFKSCRQSIHSLLVLTSPHQPFFKS